MKLISIIIPVRDRYYELEVCVESIIKQQDNRYFEIIIVDDGSHCNYTNLIKKWEGLCSLKFVKQVALGIAAARNRGFEIAEGEFLLFIDSDCILEKDCLSNFVDTYKKFTHEKAFQLNLIGNIKNRVGLLEHLRLFSTLNSLKTDTNHINYLNTSGFAIKKDVLKKIGLFNVLLKRGEDTELLSRLLKHEKYFPYFIENATVIHSPPLKLFKYIIKHFSIGFYTYFIRFNFDKEKKPFLKFSNKMIMLKEMVMFCKKNKLPAYNVILVLASYFCELFGRSFSFLAKRKRRIDTLFTHADCVNEEYIIYKMVYAASNNTGMFVSYLTAWSLILIKKNLKFRETLKQADIIAADGMGVVLSVFLTKFSFIKKVTLHDYYISLIKEIANRQIKIALIGGADGLAEKAAIEMKRLEPSIQILFSNTGYLQTQEDHIALQAKLKKEKPQFIFLGMSQPVQEIWIQNNREILPNAVYYCVGAFFEYLVFEEYRLPESLTFIRKIGFEWLWRLAKSPKLLFYRYIVGLPMLFYQIILYNFSREKWLKKNQ